MEKITKIKEQLPQGAQTAIAKKAGVPVALVNRVLNDKAEDITVINAIADYYADYKAKKEKAIKRIEDLT